MILRTLFLFDLKFSKKSEDFSSEIIVCDVKRMEQLRKLRWLAYETYTCNQESDDEDVRKVDSEDESSDLSASYNKVMKNVYHKKNFHDDEENSFASAKSHDEEGLINKINKLEKVDKIFISSSYIPSPSPSFDVSKNLSSKDDEDLSSADESSSSSSDESIDFW